MKYADISGMSGKELLKKVKDLRGQMFEARMKNSMGQLTNPMSIRVLRRDIARMQTALTALDAKAPAPAKKSAKPAAKPTKARATKAKAKGK